MTVYQVDINDDAIVWTNKAGKKATFTRGCYYGFNGAEARRTPSNQKDLIESLRQTINNMGGAPAVCDYNSVLQFMNSWLFSFYMPELQELAETAHYKKVIFDTGWDITDGEIERIFNAIKPRLVDNGDYATKAALVADLIIASGFSYDNNKELMEKMFQNKSFEKKFIDYANYLIGGHTIRYDTLHSEMQEYRIGEYLCGAYLKTFLPHELNEYQPKTIEVACKAMKAALQIPKLGNKMQEFTQEVAKLVRNDGIISLWSAYHLKVDYWRDYATEHVVKLLTTIANLQLNNDQDISFSGNLSKKYYELYLIEESKKDMTFEQAQLKRDLQFCDDLFVVVVPTTKEELIEEGERQHNCVGRYGYYEKVINNDCNIVFIRRKNDPTKNFVTVEITSYGSIVQCLSAFNRSYNQAAHSPEEANALQHFVSNYRQYLATIF